jgi:formylmethanofuran dehydrogenase subunit E-like metal-binding protein
MIVLLIPAIIFSAYIYKKYLHLSNGVPSLLKLITAYNKAVVATMQQTDSVNSTKMGCKYWIICKDVFHGKISLLDLLLEITYKQETSDGRHNLICSV